MSLENAVAEAMRANITPLSCPIQATTYALIS